MAVLQDGRVLIAGGMVENGVFLSSAELFDPATGRSSTTDNMQSHRVGTAQRFSLMAPYRLPEDWLGAGLRRGYSAGSLSRVALGQPLGVLSITGEESLPHRFVSLRRILCFRRNQ